MEHSKEYYEQLAFASLAKAYKEIPKEGLKAHHGILLCPYCKNAALKTDEGYKCDDYSCPLCMMGIWLGGEAPAVEPGLLEAVESIVVPQKEEEKPKKRRYTRRKNGGNNYLGGMPPSLVRQYKTYAESTDPQYREAFKAAKTGVIMSNGKPHCPYCGKQVYINSSQKPNEEGIRKRCYKCEEPNCKLHKCNVVIHSFEHAETKEYHVRESEFYTDENICLALGIKQIATLDGEELPDRKPEPQPMPTISGYTPAPPPEISMEPEPIHRDKDYIDVPRPTIPAMPVKAGGNPLQFLTYDRRLRPDERKKAKKAVKLLSAIQSAKIQTPVDRIAKSEGISTYRALKRYAMDKYPNIYKKIWKGEKAT